MFSTRLKNLMFTSTLRNIQTTHIQYHIYVYNIINTHTREPKQDDYTQKELNNRLIIIGRDD